MAPKTSETQNTSFDDAINKMRAMHNESYIKNVEISVVKNEGDTKIRAAKSGTVQ